MNSNLSKVTNPLFSDEFNHSLVPELKHKELNVDDLFSKVSIDSIVLIICIVFIKYFYLKGYI